MIMFFAGSSEAVTLKPGEISTAVYVEGKKINTDAFISKEGRTMVPLRAVSEAWGCSVSYVADNPVPVQIRPNLPLNKELEGVAKDIGYFAFRQISQGQQVKPDNLTFFFVARVMDKTASKITTGQYKVTETFFCDKAPEIREGVTYIPIRALSESMGCMVEYDSYTNKVRIGPYNPDIILDRFHNLYGEGQLSGYVCGSDMTKSIVFVIKDAKIVNNKDSHTLRVYGIYKKALHPAAADGYLNDVQIYCYVNGDLIGSAEQPQIKPTQITFSGGYVEFSLDGELEEGRNELKLVIKPDEKFFERDYDK